MTFIKNVPHSEMNLALDTRHEYSTFQFWNAKNTAAKKYPLPFSETML